MRVCLILLMLSCGPRPPVKGPDQPPTDSSEAPGCVVHERRLSATGRGGARPSVAAASDNQFFGVVWEDLDESHSGIRFQAVDLQAQPLAPSVEIADLQKGGAEPRVIADGDGFVVSWTVESSATSVIALRRVDSRGKPRGDVIPAVSAPSVRSLALSRFGEGFALVWWSWASSPPLQALTLLDKDGRPRGKNLELSRTPLVEPIADLLPDGDMLKVAWEEQHQGLSRVMVGRAASSGISARLDLGPGDAPSLTQTGVVFAHLDDASIWWSPLEVAKPQRFTDGQYPDARPLGPERGVLCVVRLAVTDEGSFDELDCMTLVHGEPVRDDKIASAPRGLVAQDVAPTKDAFGVVYQTQEPDAMAVHLSTAKCP
jgi:hypothetical protein